MPQSRRDQGISESPLRPFCTEPWPDHSAAAARALWDWHVGLYHTATASGPSDGARSVFRDDGDRALQGLDLSTLPPSITSPAYDACQAHNLDRELLAAQVRVAERLVGSIRFADQREFEDFIGGWAVPHARLLARLADAAHSWHLRYVDSLARGLFLVGRIVHLAEDVRADRIFVPMSDLEVAGLSLAELEEGRITEPAKRMLWKQIVRARDALAQGAPLANEVAPRFSREIKRVWMGSIELLNEIERRDYDVWSSPPNLKWRHRIQVRFQARFGRTAFRNR